MSSMAHKPYGCGVNCCDACEIHYEDDHHLNDDKQFIVHPYTRWHSYIDHPRTHRTNSLDVVSDDLLFQLKLDCSHFKPNEIDVKSVDNQIVIHGKHEETSDAHGFVTREFTRKYDIPDDCDVNDIKATLVPMGVLTIAVPKISTEPPKDNEKVIKIQVPTHKPGHPMHQMHPIFPVLL